jgi:hypothetical protein
MLSDFPYNKTGEAGYGTDERMNSRQVKSCMIFPTEKETEKDFSSQQIFTIARYSVAVTSENDLEQTLNSKTG